MINYVIGADGYNKEIPGVYQENFQSSFIEPSRVSDGSHQYDTDFGDNVIATIRTRPKVDSNKTYWQLYGYIKGRAGQSETIYLDRLKTTIVGYIRFPSTETNIQGSVKNKREMEIQIIQK